MTGDRADFNGVRGARLIVARCASSGNGAPRRHRLGDENFDTSLWGGVRRLRAGGPIDRGRAERVLLLEYGGSDRSIFIQMPFGAVHTDEHGEVQLFYTRNRSRIWMGGACIRRVAKCWRILVDQWIGVHRERARLRGWSAQGREGLAYRDVLPYFRRAEPDKRWR